MVIRATRRSRRLAVQRKYLHFSVILRPWVMVRPRESNPRPPALQSNALPTELILPRLMKLNSRMLWNGRHVVYFTVNFKSKNLITYLALVVFRFIWWHFFGCFVFRLYDSFLILLQITHLTLYKIRFLYFRIVISVFIYTTRVLVPDSGQ